MAKLMDGVLKPMLKEGRRLARATAVEFLGVLKKYGVPLPDLRSAFLAPLTILRTYFPPDYPVRNT